MYSEEGPGTLVGCGPLLAVPNVIVHPSTASASITVLLYDGPLLCGFNVAIKGLTSLAVQVALHNKTAAGVVMSMTSTLDD